MNIVGNKDIDEEYLLFEFNENKDKIIKSLELVSKYIVDNELLIIGGMSIDFALRLKNDSIYNPTYQIPDYDIISPDNITHANAIGKLLCAEGITNIAIVPAVHKTTVRVQLLGYTVFDATFIPKNLYENIPHMKYKDYKFIDPVYQKIDQYSSLSFLWEVTGPSFNIINRFKKDVDRKNKLGKYYNLTKKDYKPIYKSIEISQYNKINKIRYINTKNDAIDKRLETNILSFDMLNNNLYNIDCDVVYHGTIAYAFYYQMFYSKYGDDKNIIIKPNINIKNNKFVIDIVGDNIQIINSNNNINNFYKNICDNEIIKMQKLSSLSTSIPNYYNISYDNHNLQIFDLCDKLLSIDHIIHNDKIVFVSNYNYLLSYFLFMYFYENDEKKEIYRAYYCSLLYMVEKDNKLFNFSLNTLGFNYSVNDNYYYYIKNYNNLIVNKKNLDDIPPKNYIGYPNCEIKKYFNKEESEYYGENQKEIRNTNFLNDLQIVKNIKL